MTLIFIFVLAWQTPPELLHDDLFAADARAAVSLLYDHQFQESQNLLKPWALQYPDHPLWVFWDALRLWWDILPDLEDTSHDEAFFHALQVTVGRCDQILSKNPSHFDALILKSLSHGFMGRHHSNRDNWYRSLQYARTAMHTVFDLHRLYPDLPDVHFGYGMYTYYAAMLREEYVWMRPILWFLPPGDRQSGLVQLRTAADEAVFMGPESLYFLGHILISYEGRYDEGDAVLSELSARHPRNIYFRRLLIRTAFWAWHRDVTLARIAALEPDGYAAALTAADQEEIRAIEGRVWLRNGNLAKASAALEHVLTLHNQLEGGWDRYYQTFAAYHLAHIYEREGRETEAQALYVHIAAQKKHAQFAASARKKLSTW